MKPKYIIVTLLTVLLAGLSCEKITPDIPVDTCTFSLETGNDTNPNTTLYQEILDEAVTKGLPGVSLVIYTPEYGLWAGCAGKASIEEQTDMQPCHLFHSASLIKPITATMIMRLVEEGDINIDNLISEYLPEDVVSRIPNGSEITVRHLLAHTSGLSHGTFDYKESVDRLNNPDRERSFEWLMENYVYNESARAGAGESLLYSNSGYEILALIIEEVSGMNIGDYFEQEISDPLGLTRTYYKSSPGYPDQLSGLVNGYMEISPGELQNCTDLDIAYTDHSKGSCGLIAAPYEFVRMYREILKGNILDPASVEVLKEDEKNYFEEIYLCQGLMKIKQYDYGDAYGHGGIYHGMAARCIYFPDSDINVGFFTNLGEQFPSENTRMFASTMDELVDVTFTGERDDN
jgi:D-alanyl-D-alanine carboxypeptidase